MPLSSYLAAKFLNHTWLGSTYTAPSTIFIGLSTTTPTAAGGNVTEPSTTTGYVRVATKFFTVATTFLTYSATAVVFPAATSAWGTQTHWLMYDTQIGGASNMLGWGQLNTAKIVSTGDSIKFNAGDISLIFGT